MYIFISYSDYTNNKRAINVILINSLVILFKD